MKTRILLVLAVVLSPVAASFGATATQKFTVVVPANVSITAPADVVINHDETDNNQAFSNQQWTVKGNTLAGVSVSFSTNQAFTHTTDSSFKRDASLSLAEASHLGPASWTISQASDSTDYINSDGVATVAASSNGVGRATFNLGVSFIGGTYGAFAAGNYETVVTGTVTAN